MQVFAEDSKQQTDQFKPVADMLFAYLHNIIYKPTEATLDVESLPESFRDFGKGLQYLNQSIGETRRFVKELAVGNLDCTLPPPGNEIASSLKMLHASLKHLTWQTQQVAKGDYNQRVSFMGDFSDAFNNMVEQLEQKQKIILDEKTRLEIYVQRILENCPNPILMFDSKGKLAYVSYSYYLYCNESMKDGILGKTIHDLFEPIVKEQALNEIVQLYESVITEERMFETEQEIDFGQYETCGHFMIQITPMKDRDGSIAGIIVFLVDITENIEARLEAERAREFAEQSTRSKSNFLATMSHEIRTPMNAILGMAELALRENVPAGAKEHIRTIRQAAVNLLSIINDILDFSKIEAGKMEIVPLEYLFSSLVNDVINIIKLKIFESRLRFVVNIDSNIPNFLLGDVIRIRQILLNLLSNAVKYTDKGFVSFSVNSEKINDEIVILKIEITDSGKGIKQDEIDKLFNEFTRFDLETNKSVEGTGLGLTITRGLVTAMNGNISVQSEYGKGSTFTVTIPQKIIRNINVAAVENPEKKNVLVYERREIYFNSIINTLDNLAVKNKLVTNISDFYDCLQSKNYSFVILASTFYEDYKNKYRDIPQNVSFAVITEFGEAITDRNINVLSMPVYSLPVANFLNGVSEESVASSSKKESKAAGFIAPEAKIMIVDDITTNLEVAEGLMLPYKMQITLCKSGMEAIEEIKLTRYDLVFMDHMMPDMNGVETVSHIRAMGSEEPYYKDVPIVALTADAVFGRKEMIMKNGFNDYLSKPIDTTRLNTVLESWIPKEKQKEQTESNSPIPVIDGNDTNKILNLDGVNTDKGIAMAGGKIERYLKILSLFHKDGLEKIKEIKNCLATGNTPLYVIHVHALKSATVIIGAEELSESAKALELAGKKGDLAYILSHNELFIKDLEDLLRKINIFLSEEEEKKQKTAIDINLLKNELSRLKIALNNFELTEINNVVESLQKYTQSAEIGDSVKAILQNKLIGEYDEAISLIDKMEKDLG